MHPLTGDARLPRYQQLRDHMVAQIANNRWRPGEAIPTEAALATEFDMSIGTVRKAVDVLVAEGVLNTASLHRAAKQKGVRMPLLDEIYAILHEGKPAKEVMRTLLSRDPRSEAD